MSIAAAAAVLLCATAVCAPSAWFAWHFRSMPHLGSYQDDTVYWLSARSLAADAQYRIPHLPEQPFQTKYPPAYPAMLSLIWALRPSFPGNLTAAMALQWSFLPFYLGLAYLFFRRCGFTGLRAWLLTLVLGAAPMTAIFATSLMTELPFSVLLLAVLLVVEDGSDVTVGRALLAGLVAAVAFLMRTNAMVLVVSVPALLLVRRQYRAAAAFGTPLLAAIAGWGAWCAMHASPFKDNILRYYTSYVGFYVQTFSVRALPDRLWVNADAIWESLARLVLFQTSDLPWIRALGWVITAAAVKGIVTLARRGVRHYAAFAILLIGVLVLWQYPPDTRFVYPLFPLYVAGLATQLTDIWALIVKTWSLRRTADRVAAVFVAALVFVIVGGCGISIANGLARVLPQYFHDREAQIASMQQVYRWIASNTPENARFAAYDDTLLYLYTGRRGYTVPVMPAVIYSGQPADARDYVTSLPGLWREKGVNYVMVTSYDFQRDLHRPAQDSLAKLVQDRTRFEPLYSDRIARVYRFAAAP